MRYFAVSNVVQAVGAPTMQLRRTRMGFRAVVMSTALLSFSGAYAQAACDQIRAACERAHFVQGAVRSGNGLQVDCIRPIMQASAQPSNASVPLPQIDPQLVVACKTENPDFGERRQEIPAETVPTTHGKPVVTNGDGSAGDAAPNIEGGGGSDKRNSS